MIEYPKIESLYNRNKETHKFDEGEWRRPEFEYLKDCEWLSTEKIHGTSTRCFWDGEKVTFGGRTSRAQMPVMLITKLAEMFQVEKFRDNEYDPLCLYGEGYGSGINKGGNYIPDGVDFILFDVRIGEWWLRWPDVQDVANKLEIQAVPVIEECHTLLDAVEVVKAGLKSQWGDFEAEGIVARPAVDLCMRSGTRMLAKIKGSDFA